MLVYGVVSSPLSRLKRSEVKVPVFLPRQSSWQSCGCSCCSQWRCEGTQQQVCSVGLLRIRTNKNFTAEDTQTLIFTAVMSLSRHTVVRHASRLESDSPAPWLNSPWSLLCPQEHRVHVDVSPASRVMWTCQCDLWTPPPAPHGLFTTPHCRYGLSPC